MELRSTLSTQTPLFSLLGFSLCSRTECGVKTGQALRMWFAVLDKNPKSHWLTWFVCWDQWPVTHPFPQYSFIYLLCLSCPSSPRCDVDSVREDLIVWAEWETSPPNCEKRQKGRWAHERLCSVWTNGQCGQWGDWWWQEDPGNTMVQKERWSLPWSTQQLVCVLTGWAADSHAWSRHHLFLCPWSWHLQALVTFYKVLLWKGNLWTDANIAPYSSICNFRESTNIDTQEKK